jgi:hypothetical protein
MARPRLNGLVVTWYLEIVSASEARKGDYALGGRINRAL